MEINVKMEINENSFPFLVRVGNFADAAFLVTYRGVNPNTIIDSEEGTTALFYVAGKRGGLDFAKALIEKGANVNERASNYTPLHYAIMAEDKELIDLLISKGAKVNDDKYSVFFCVKNVEMAEFLISKGADINFLDSYNRNPLYIAVKINSKELVEFFINKGTQLNIKDRYDSTPLDIATSDEIKQILINAGAKSGKDL